MKGVKRSLTAINALIDLLLKPVSCLLYRCHIQRFSMLIHTLVKRALVQVTGVTALIDNSLKPMTWAEISFPLYLVPDAAKNLDGL